MGIEFLNVYKEKNAESLCSWFNSKGYSVGIEECKKLVDNNDHLIHMGTVITAGNY